MAITALYPPQDGDCSIQSRLFLTFASAVLSDVLAHGETYDNQS